MKGPRFDQPKEPVEQAIRRIACAQIDRALAIIDDPDIAVARKVHRVRQQCKTLRALLRLIRPSFAGYDAMNALFRDIARTLSGSRDAKVMIETFDSLIEQGRHGLSDKDIAAIRARLGDAQEAAPDQTALLAQSRGRLLDARAHAARWTVSADGWHSLSGGLKKTYRRARRDMKAAKAHPNAAISHDWRKYVKHHGEHLRLLRAIRPDMLHTGAKQAHKLADRLGQRHDIDMLLDHLAGDRQDTENAAILSDLRHVSDKRRARLDRKAQKLGKDLFDVKPDALVRHWAQWWQHWHIA
jgi:hypothetical protein